MLVYGWRLFCCWCFFLEIPMKDFCQCFSNKNLGETCVMKTWPTWIGSRKNIPSQSTGFCYPPLKLTCFAPENGCSWKTKVSLWDSDYFQGQAASSREGKSFFESFWIFWGWMTIVQNWLVPLLTRHFDQVFTWPFFLFCISSYWTRRTGSFPKHPGLYSTKWRFRFTIATIVNGMSSPVVTIASWGVNPTHGVLVNVSLLVGNVMLPLDGKG